MRHLLSIVFAAFLFGSGSASADCDPMKFQIQDIDNLTVDSRVALAVFSSMSKEDYESNQHKLDSSGSAYEGVFKGSESYSDFKNRVNRERKRSSYSLQTSDYTKYVGQHLSATAAANYQKCLETDLSLVGFNIYLKDRNEPLFTLRAIWAGGLTEDAMLATEPALENLQILGAVPKSWKRAVPHNIIFKRLDATKPAAVVLSVKINENDANTVNGIYTIVPDPTIQEFTTEFLKSPKLIETQAGTGTNSPTNTTTKSDCIYAPAGSFFVPETAKIVVVNTVRPDRTNAILDVKDENQVCGKVIADPQGGYALFTSISAEISVVSRKPK